MDSPPTRLKGLIVCEWLSACLIACSLAGCGTSPTTLAVESTTSTSRPSPPVEVTANPGAGQEPGTLTENASEPAKPDPAPPETTQPEAPVALKPRLTKVDPKDLIGRWRDSFFGTRTLTLNADGTARMELDLDFAGRLLYGIRLDFDMKWTLEGGTISIDVIEGKPSKQAKSAMETWGSRYMYLLDNIEDHQIEMRDWDGTSNYTLRRLPDEGPKDQPDDK